jgi:hypothetical protein
VIEGSVEPFYQVELQATDGGKISLARLASVRGAIDVFAEGPGSTVDLPALQGRLANTQPGTASFQVRRGGAVLMPNVTALDNIDLIVRGTGQIPVQQFTAITAAEVTFDGNTNDFPALLNIAGSNVTLENQARLTLPGLTQLTRAENGNVTCTVLGAGSVLTLPNVVQAAVNDFYQLELFGFAGGGLLPKLANINGAIDLYAEGTGSVVNLLWLRRFHIPRPAPLAWKSGPVGASCCQVSMNRKRRSDRSARANSVPGCCGRSSNLK